MAKILKFPSRDELKKKEMWKEYDEETEALNRQSEECVSTAHFLLDVLEEFIQSGEASQAFMDMNFRDEIIQESRDMFVIVNMLNAMFNRYYGIPHALHREMDRVYTKIKLIDSQNEKARQDLEDEFDIVFSPDFEPENPDDTD